MPAIFSAFSAVAEERIFQPWAGAGGGVPSAPSGVGVRQARRPDPA